MSKNDYCEIEIFYYSKNIENICASKEIVSQINLFSDYETDLNTFHIC